MFFVVSIAAKSQQFGASEIPASNNKPDFTIEDDQGPSIGIEELFRDFERPGIIVVTSFINDLSSMIRLIYLFSLLAKIVFYVIAKCLSKVSEYRLIS